MKVVNDAVILAAGNGTRMLPASQYVPKEVLPLVDTPLINHLIWEACKSGVKNIHIVLTSEKKKYIEEVLSKNVSNYMRLRPDLPILALKPVPEGVQLILHEQKKQNGVGGAISTAIKNINGPFLVLLGDNLLINKHKGPKELGPDNSSDACKKLVESFNENGLACAGILKVPDSERSKYGVVNIDNGFIKKISEKLEKEIINSNFILCGRYLLTEETKDLLEIYTVEKYGELQSIEIFKHFIRNDGFRGVNLEDYAFYDSGNPFDWLKGQIDHAIQREDMGDELLKWLKKRIIK